MQRLFLLLAIMTSMAAHATTLELETGVREQLEQAITRGEVRAAVVGLYDHGQAAVFGFGQLSDADKSRPGRDTVFEIGSISKVFTAALAQTQIDAGRLGWDQTLAQRFPDQSFINESVAAIRVRELADHTSGLPRLPGNMKSPDPLDPYAGYDREALLTFVTSYDPEALDKSYEYSNLGAGLLGEIAADAAGKSYADAMHQEVLAVLNMTSTQVGLPGGTDARLAAGFSQGANMPNWAGFDALAGAGALTSTVDDLLEFVAANLNGGPLSAALGAIREPQSNGVTALGWHLEATSSSNPLHWHNGGTGGYASFLSLDSNAKTGVVMLTASTEYNRITELGFAQSNGPSQQSTGTEDLSGYVGAYKLSEGFVMTVFQRDGQLLGQATGQGSFPLTPKGDHEFVFPAANIRIVFAAPADGTSDQLTLYQAGQVMPAPRVDSSEGVVQRTEIELTEAQLRRYTGQYLLAPGVIIKIELRDRQLYAQLTGQAAYPIFAYAPDKFFYRVVDAQLHFETDDEQVATAVVLHQQGQQRAPRLD